MDLKLCFPANGSEGGKGFELAGEENISQTFMPLEVSCQKVVTSGARGLVAALESSAESLRNYSS